MRQTGRQHTPIPIDEAVASLSAILLDDAYYEFILAGRKEADGLPWVGEDKLIPLKASAWLDLGERQAKGEKVDTKNIRKHANDVLRLSQLLAPDVRIPVAARITRDLNRFLDGIEADRSIDLKSIKTNNSVAEIVERIARAYEIRSTSRDVIMIDARYRLRPDSFTRPAPRVGRSRAITARRQRTWLANTPARARLERRSS